MDVSTLITYLLTPVAQIALIIGLAELAKRSGCPHRYIPLLDLGLGLVSGLCIYHLTMHYGIAESCVLGIALGLSACGLFSGIKNTTQSEEDVMDYLEEGKE